MAESTGLPAILLGPAGVVAAGVFGAIWGSFFNVCIARVPLGQSVVRPGSRCDDCGAPVRAQDNIPLVSYLLHYFAFAGVLLVLSAIDLRSKRLPDVITLPAIPILFLSGFGAHDVGWLERLIGGAAGYLVFRLPSDFYYYVLKREGLGLGDAKLLALIGVVLGWKALAFVIFTGGFVGALVSIPFVIRARTSLRTAEVPFGPFLALSALVYLFAGRWIFEVWLG